MVARKSIDYSCTCKSTSSVIDYRSLVEKRKGIMSTKIKAWIADYL